MKKRRRRKKGRNIEKQNEFSKNFAPVISLLQTSWWLREASPNIEKRKEFSKNFTLLQTSWGSFEKLRRNNRESIVQRNYPHRATD